MTCFFPANMFFSKSPVFLFFLLASAMVPSCLCSGSQDSLPFRPQECIHQHFSALLQLKRGFSFYDIDYNDPDLSSWNPDKRDCCAWEGITCDGGTGHVTILDLSDFHLSGEIDFQSLSQLGSLRILNLAHNYLIDPSPIPPAIGQLHSLTHLNLSSLNFYGQIPIEMSNLTRLVSLDLSGNGHYNLKVEKGSIGALIQNMSRLRQLFLDDVNMSIGGSEWSSAISSALPNLHELSMEDCGLSGPIHSSFFHLPSLSQLHLSYNNLSFSELDFNGNLSSLTSLSLRGLHGKFPAKFWKLPHLSELDISENDISSPLLDLISELPSLTKLRLSGCRFHGKFPAKFWRLPHLSELDISWNNISSVLLDLMGELTSLTKLQLSGCRFHGKFPAKFWRLPHLSELDLSGNNIPSPLLDLISELTSLTKLQLSFCTFHGKFPAKIWKLPHLSELDISGNDVSSALLDFIGKLSSLTSLRLSLCRFHVRFSAKNWRLSHLSELDLSHSDLSSSGLNSIGNLSSLTSLRISGCGLHGRYLDKILRLPFLTILQASNNDFSSVNLNMFGNFSSFKSLTQLLLPSCSMSGPLPSWLGNFTRLETLDLSSNSFSGFIPSSYGNGLLNLKEIYLDRNLLNGTIPSSLFCLPSLRTLSLWNNQLGGQLDEFHNNASYSSSLEYINLSNNKLQGRIPRLFCHGNFTKLKILDLSYNHLSGFIPSSYGNGLPNLKEIHLDSNLLDGTIPSSLFSFPLLRRLSLWNNQLGGEIDEFRNNASYSSSLEYIDLSHNKLEGRIPSMLFCHGNCTRLEILDLSTNSFSGFIPSSLGTGLPNLKEIYLDGNLLNGTIPSSLFTLPSLRRLNLRSNQLGGQLEELHSNASFSSSLELIDLSYNKLQGRIPSMSSSLGNFIRLENLDLSDNNFSGKIPSSLFSLPSLRSLSLSNNQLGDKLDEFYNASSLSLNYIDLSHNKLQGMIPRSICQLQNLAYIDLLLNNFSDTLDLVLFQNLTKLSVLALSNINVLDEDGNSNSNSFPQLSTLILSSCNIKTFPNFLRNQWSLTYLDLSINKMNGEIPKWIWKVGNGHLEYLNFSHNALQAIGMLTFNLSLRSLIVLDLSSNVLQSLFPIPSYDLEFYSVSNNSLSGEIPESICNFKNLKVLDISHNKFSGHIPQCVGEISNRLEMLNLQVNAFIGSLPQIFQKDCSLQILDFSENKFQGQLPMSIANCKGLRVLNVRCNKINDTFPLWIQGLPNLSILILKSNNFHGPLNISPNFTSKLQIFDVSSNNFTGSLPSTMFWRWKEMASKNDSQPEYLFDVLLETREESELTLCGLFCETVVITSKSIEMALSKIRTAITVVDLSNNHFQGSIPESIGNLKMLRWLNLSHNGFTGRIPTSLKNLILLESLDLSKNNFSGQIPPELLDLTFLEVLDLSWNQLIGSIPYGKQFFTFTNKSYEGNLGLCGLPLSKECESINDAPPSVAKDVELLSEGEYDWKMVALGFGIGYGVGVGGFCWTLVLWRKGRRVYNRYVYKVLIIFSTCVVD